MKFTYSKNPKESVGGEWIETCAELFIPPVGVLLLTFPLSHCLRHLKLNNRAPSWQKTIIVAIFILGIQI